MRFRLVLCLVSAVAVFMPLTFVFPMPAFGNETQCVDPRGSEKWAVILSPGPEAGVAWGGYHVTVTGYSSTHACRCEESCCDCRDLSKILAFYFSSIFKSKPWHLHGDLYPLKQWGEVWTQTITSGFLNDLAQELNHEGFDRIKGPHYASKAWHITLHKNKAKSIQVRSDFKNNKVDWYLWLVPESGADCKSKGIDCPLDRWKRIEAAP